jgi:hypothetical protein
MKLLAPLTFLTLLLANVNPALAGDLTDVPTCRERIGERVGTCEGLNHITEIIELAPGEQFQCRLDFTRCAEGMHIGHSDSLLMRKKGKDLVAVDDTDQYDMMLLDAFTGLPVDLAEYGGVDFGSHVRVSMFPRYAEGIFEYPTSDYEWIIQVRRSFATRGSNKAKRFYLISHHSHGYLYEDGEFEQVQSE